MRNINCVKQSNYTYTFQYSENDVYNLAFGIYGNIALVKFFNSAVFQINTSSDIACTHQNEGDNGFNYYSHFLIPNYLFLLFCWRLFRNSEQPQSLLHGYLRQQSPFNFSLRPSSSGITKTILFLAPPQFCFSLVVCPFFRF